MALRPATDDERCLVMMALKCCDGEVRGSSMSKIARQVRPRGMSINRTKVALGSLAHSHTRRRHVTLTRNREEDIYILSIVKAPTRVLERA